MKILKSLTAVALLSVHLVSAAEDIDLFAGTTAASTAEVPNVLIIVDNTANWNSAFTNEMNALSSTLNSLAADKFRIGIMMFSESGGSNSGNDGGYVRAAIRLMSSTNKPKYQAMVNNFDKLGDKSNGGKASLLMAEVYRYFSGGIPYAGNNKTKTDYSGSTAGNTQDVAVHALAGNALASKAGSPYVSPTTSACQKNYIIYISNGPAQDNSGDLATSMSMLSAAGGSTTAIPISPSGSQDSVADEWARWMKKSPLGIVTYTLDVDPGTSGQGPGWTALLKSIANVGGGKYYSVSSTTGSTDISLALSKTFSEIQAVNSVFAAVSLPISVNAQGTYLNQVFVGMFRPDRNNFPRWAGNLKQYKMGYSNGSLKLLDADSASAINSQTGFITECARSYWTPSTADSYWGFRPQGTCIPPGGSSADLYQNSNFPDGNIVEKGAQAYTLRSTTTRTVNTCSPTFGSCNALTSFDTSNAAITEGLLGASSTSDRDQLINWGRGLDMLDENVNATTSTEMRASVHGDVVHSRPVALNFGTDSAPSIVVFYGGNDGVLRAVNGNRSNSIGSITAGSELWSFVAPEFYSNLKRIRDNTTPITTPSVAGSANPKPYGFDGPITAFKDASRAWIYATMRRGGRALYAFNVNTSDPTNITLKWKKGCPSNFPSSGTVSDTDCSSGFDGIGQTWSAPKSFKASGYNAGTVPMLIMGGGYDTCEDGDPNTCTSTSKGNKIYVLDADTGAVLKTLNTDRSVVSELTIVRDSSGLATYAYATDLGGNLYRVNIKSAAPASWTITKVASLGCDTVASCAANRKFMFAPDVVVDNGTNIILLGSGDREKPLASYTSAYGVSNYFFMIKDKPEEATWLTSESTNCSSTAVICKASLAAVAAGSGSVSQATVDAKKGWYLGLSAHEQVVTSSVTLFGTVTFSTHQPAVVVSGSCGSNLGVANVYNVRYTNADPASGTSRYQRISGDGLPPSPVGGRVTLDDGKTVPFVIGASGNSPLESKEGDPGTSSTASQPKNRVYWYIQK